MLLVVPKQQLAVAMVVNESGARGDAAIATLVTDVLNDAGVASPWAD